ncbi:hypothetical protein [Robiginitomaculum antarcticum]|nr:hypothetical protein [Robiginitomaculum antarcticum]
MISLIQSGVSIFGLFTMDPALLAFLMGIGIFGLLNFIEYKRFD